MVWVLNPGGGEILRPYRAQRQPNPLYNGYRVSTPRVKWPGRDADPNALFYL